jgi:hypothetical protein
MVWCLLVWPVPDDALIGEVPRFLAGVEVRLLQGAGN